MRRVALVSPRNPARATPAAPRSPAADPDRDPTCREHDHQFDRRSDDDRERDDVPSALRPPVETILVAKPVVDLL
jgi:hypothetical protein